MEGNNDPLIKSLVAVLGVDTQSATAAIFHFVDGLPHAEVGARMGMPAVEAQALAYSGLRSIKEAADDLPLRLWRASTLLN